MDNFNTSVTTHLWATFPDYESAAKSIAAFMDHGVPADHVHLMTETVPPQYLSRANVEPESQAKEGITVTTSDDAKIGAVRGTGIGLGAGILAGLASLAIPGFGLVIGGGALATAIAGAAGTTAAGALTGAVTGYLRDQGAGASMIEQVTKGLSAGSVIVNVNCDPDDDIDPALAYDLIVKYGGAEIMEPTVVT